MAQRGKPADLQRVPANVTELQDALRTLTAENQQISRLLSQAQTEVAELREELFKLMSLPPGDECPVCGGVV